MGKPFRSSALSLRASDGAHPSPAQRLSGPAPCLQGEGWRQQHHRLGAEHSPGRIRAAAGGQPWGEIKLPIVGSPGPDFLATAENHPVIHAASEAATVSNKKAFRRRRSRPERRAARAVNGRRLPGPGLVGKAMMSPRGHWRGKGWGGGGLLSLLAPLQPAPCFLPSLLVSPWLSPSCFLGAVLYVERWELRGQGPQPHGCHGNGGRPRSGFRMESRRKCLTGRTRMKEGTRPARPARPVSGRTGANRRGSGRSRRGEWGSEARV